MNLQTLPFCLFGRYYNLNVAGITTVKQLLTALREMGIPFKDFILREQDDPSVGWQVRMQVKIAAAKTEDDWIAILSTITNGGKPSVGSPPPRPASATFVRGLQSQT